MWIGWLGIAAALVACAPDRSAAGSGAEAEIQCEVKVTLASEEIADALRRLGLVEAEASRLMLWYFDSRELELLDHGVILRGRRIAGERDKSTAKLRFRGASASVPGWLEVHGFKREADLTGSKEVMSWGLTAKTEEGAIESVLAGIRPVDALFNAEQRKLIADCSPIPVDWGDLVPLGPIEAKIWSVESGGRAGDFHRKLTAERWTLPNGTDLLQVSTRAPGHEAAAAQAELLGYLESLGLSLSLRQETKTRIALEYFSAR